MFNLEKSIAEWREQMLAAGIKSPVPLEELEIHLRDEIERQTRVGRSERDAFDFAIRKIGQASALKGEFQKNERTFMKQTAKIVTGVIGILTGAAMMVPGTIQMQHEMGVTTSKLGLWLLGWALVGGSVLILQRMLLPKLFKIESERVELTPMKQAVKIGAGITVLLMGVAFLLPAAVQGMQEGVIKFEAVFFLVFGIALLITGGLVTLCPYKRRVA